MSRWIEFPHFLKTTDMRLTKRGTGVSASTSIEGFRQTVYGFNFLWALDVSFPPCNGEEAREFESFFYGLEDGINAVKVQLPRVHHVKNIYGFASPVRDYVSGETIIEIDISQWGSIGKGWRLGIAGKFGLYSVQNLKLEGNIARIRILPGLRNNISIVDKVHLLPRLAMQMIPGSSGFVEAGNFQSGGQLSLIEIPQSTVDLNQISDSFL